MQNENGVVVGAGAGQVLLTDRWWLMLNPADTPGGMGMMAVVLPAGAPSVRPHRHLRHDEIWYVLEGELSFRLGSRAVIAGAGTCVAAPRGVIHHLENATDGEVRYLTMSTPGAEMGYFAELGALIMATSSGTLDRAQWNAIAATYDVEFCDLPPLVPEPEA